MVMEVHVTDFWRSCKIKSLNNNTSFSKIQVLHGDRSACIWFVGLVEWSCAEGRVIICIIQNKNSLDEQKKLWLSVELKNKQIFSIPFSFTFNFKKLAITAHKTTKKYCSVRATTPSALFSFLFFLNALL